MSCPRGLTVSQYRIVTAAMRLPLRRVTGGWLGHDGHFIRKRVAALLQTNGLLERIERPLHGPGLVPTLRAKALLAPPPSAA